MAGGVVIPDCSPELARQLKAKWDVQRRAREAANPATGPTLCLAAGCQNAVGDSVVFCRSCDLDERANYAAIFAGIVAWAVAFRGLLLIESVPQHLRVFYVIGMGLIGFKAIKVIWTAWRMPC